MVYCKVCEKEIPYQDWREHVRRHKVDFCIKHNLDPEGWWEVEWENVIRAYNPTMAKPRPEELKSLDPQKLLTKFLMITIIMIIMCTSCLAYYTGYQDYPMNRTRAEKILSTIPAKLTEGLTRITFSNSKCVSHYNDKCNDANINYKGKNIWITIGKFNNLTDDEITFLLYHELKHLEQIKKEKIKDYENGFSQEIEDEANQCVLEKTYGGIEWTN